jgi:hypothetical protein
MYIFLFSFIRSEFWSGIHISDGECQTIVYTYDKGNDWFILNFTYQQLMTKALANMRLDHIRIKGKKNEKLIMRQNEMFSFFL